jgi:hypothetical protein
MKSVFHATDIYSAVWPLHFMSRIFGLAPYSLKPESQSVKYEIIITNFSRIWSTFCIIWFVALEYIHVTRSIVANVTLKQKITEILRFTSMYSYSIITIFLSLTINRGKVQEIIGKFSDIDQLFSSKMYRTKIYMNTRLIFTIQFAIIISTFIIICAVVCVTDDSLSITD